VIQLSFALSDRKRLETLFTSAGFQDIRIEREMREDVIASFDDYWDPIEAGTGSRAARLQDASATILGARPIGHSAVVAHQTRPAQRWVYRR